jgi:hypothetical protein
LDNEQTNFVSGHGWGSTPNLGKPEPTKVTRIRKNTDNSIRSVLPKILVCCSSFWVVRYSRNLQKINHPVCDRDSCCVIRVLKPRITQHESRNVG